MSEKQLPGVRREEIGFIFQNYNLIPTLSALENMELSMRFSRMKKVGSKTRDSIVRIFRELSEKGQTILVVTHDP